MSYLLGAITLPNPTNFTRKQIEVGASNTSLTGRTSKDIFHRKEQFVLEFEWISSADVTNIIGEYDLQTCRNFQVTETNLTIAATLVHIEIDERAYHKGPDYYENFVLTLTEET